MEFITSKEAMKEHQKLKSRWSLETSISQRVIISILNKLEQPQKREDKLIERIDKLERDLDFYIKEYPEQLKQLEEKEK